ncbi:hypothetical protein [Tsuneonella suprasediminis]|uniref:hypothetical protein n=1 Tax=Tsuneonella suprasediminis TaxID=2306996 RepID=UPI002F952823
MQIVRTLVWTVLLVLLLAFSFFNWKPVEVQIWSNLVLETKVPALVIVSFLLGLVPMWLLHRGVKWRLGRRIGALETAARSKLTPPPAPPAPTPATVSPTVTEREEPPVATVDKPVSRDDIVG